MCDAFFDESVSIDRVVLSLACQVKVRKTGLLRVGVVSSFPVPESWISKTVGAMLDFVLMHFSMALFLWLSSRLCRICSRKI